jgi:hypothetical protein
MPASCSARKRRIVEVWFALVLIESRAALAHLGHEGRLSCGSGNEPHRRGELPAAPTSQGAGNRSAPLQPSGNANAARQSGHPRDAAWALVAERARGGRRGALRPLRRVTAQACSSCLRRWAWQQVTWRSGASPARLPAHGSPARCTCCWLCPTSHSQHTQAPGQRLPWWEWHQQGSAARRFEWLTGDPGLPQWQQCFSYDAGQTWTLNWRPDPRRRRTRSTAP